MTGFLKAVDTPATQTIGVLREDGQVERCVVEPGNLSTATQETVSVVVPAVLDGQVGYVDAAFVGALAAVPANAPIFGNPSADLVAAGAGGGFINCRVPGGGGAVRCAFIGPLAGGAVDFTFAALLP